MQASGFWRRFVGTVESSDLDDLRRDMILGISAAVLLVGWLALLSAIGYEGRLEYLPAAFILLAGSAGSFWLRLTHYRAALNVLMATMLGALMCFKWFAPDSLAQYYFPVAIVVSSLLISSTRVFVLATMAALACAVVAHARGASWFDQQQIITPLVLIYLTAFAAWLSSRQVNMALEWLHTSYRKAETLVEELRDERLALARTLKTLEEAYVRIEKMNYALIEARSMAEEARRLKAEFAANVSHEMRTPLNIIIGFSETMANAPETYAGVAWSSVLRGDVEQIYQNARHLSSLIDDILDLSALDVHRLGLMVEEASIQEVIEQAVAVVQDFYRAKDLYLAVRADPELPLLRMDSTRIRQVLINLLTNASRFTSVGGVTITARLVGEEIEVAVTDTGVGIAPQHVARVFEDFGQVDGSTSRRHEGTGLGVPLSKRLVELHGGRMWLESRLGRGSTFYFTLPIPAQLDADLGQAALAAPGRAMTYRKAMLAVEPDPLLLRTIRRHLGGYDVIEARDRADLPALIDRHQPVALVIDQPDGQDVPLIQEWTAAAPHDLPVIAISLPGSLRTAQRLGIQGVLVKPVLREQLLNAIAAITPIDGLGRPVQTVLMVDDDPQQVELVSRMLQSAGGGYHPLKALGGGEALARLRRESIDLVLLDLMMPEVSGLMVLQAMKSDPALAHIPVIVISGQYAEMISSSGRLSLSLVRAQNASIAETLNCLQSLAGALPPRGLPPVGAGPALPAVPDGQLAS
jgi:signal transduction histidine kinase/DNA-binding response OmpR family regulator